MPDSNLEQGDVSSIEAEEDAGFDSQSQNSIETAKKNRR
jgi:hypothetical protein